MPVRLFDVSFHLFRILKITQHFDLYRQEWIITFVNFTLQCSRQYDRDSKTGSYGVEWRNFSVKCMLGE